MTAVVLPFPQRGPWKVELLREGPAFLVRARDHGWLHGSLADALVDAQWLAAHAGIAIAILTDTAFAHSTCGRSTALRRATSTLPPRKPDKTEQAAHEAYCVAAREIHGEFARAK